MRIASGTVDQVISFVAVDSTDLKTRETTLTTFTVYRCRNGGAVTIMTTPTVTELDATNMPGVYKLLLDEDMTIAAGNSTEEMVFHITQASMAPVTIAIELFRPTVTEGNTLTVDASGNGASDIIEILGAAVSTSTAQLGVNAVQAGGTAWASGAITAAVFAANAINAAKLDPDVATELNAGILAVLGALADAAADGDVTATDTVMAYTKQLVNTLVTTVGIGTFPASAAPGNGVSLAEAIRQIYDEVAGLNGVTTPTAAEIADAVLDEDMTAHQTLGSLGQAIGDPVADTNTIYKAVVTDATGATVGLDVVAVKAETALILEDTGTTLDGRIPAALVGGRMDSDVGAKTGNVALSTQEKADVNAEVVDTLSTDTLTLPGQAAPPLAPTMREVLAWVYKAFRNRKTQTATQWNLYNDAETVIDSKAVVSSDGTTSIKQEIISGP